MRITDEDLKDMIPRNQFAWPVPDLAADLIDARGSIRILESMLEAEKKSWLDLSHEMERFKSRIKDMEALSNSQAETMDAMDRGVKF